MGEKQTAKVQGQVHRIAVFTCIQSAESNAMFTRHSKIKDTWKHLLSFLLPWSTSTVPGTDYSLSEQS